MNEESIIERQLTMEEFSNIENQRKHLTYEQEFTFYKSVAAGDIKKVEEIFLPLKSEGLGKLSENTIRNMKYHLVVTTALITRFCIEAGLLPEEAYSISDIYIRKLDNLQSESEISELHKKLVFDCTSRMSKLQRKRNYSMHVSMTVDYVYAHLHDKITLDDIAEELKINKTYLCKLFMQETGFTIGNYILECKINATKNMLKFSEYSCSSISNYFGFSSQSHFITSFKKVTGMTPKEYRSKNFRKEFT